MLSALLQELVFDSLPEGAVWPFDRTYIRPPHFHGQLECLLVKRGTAVLWLGPRAVKVRQGQLCWVLPGVPHVMDEFSADFDMWVVHLEANLVASCWRDEVGGVDVADDSPFAGWSVPLGEMLAGRTIVDAGEDDARPLCERASSIWAATDRAQARRALAELCRLALRATRGSIDAGRELSVAELAACLLLSSPTTDRPGAAAEIGVSEGFLSRAMHRDLGVTFVEQRARARVTHFLALVQQGESNLLAAALGAGFGSYAQFYRTFCRVSGSRPRDYFAVGRRHSSLIVAADRQRPTSSVVMALPEHRRQHAPL